MSLAVPTARFLIANSASGGARRSAFSTLVALGLGLGLAACTQPASSELEPAPALEPAAAPAPSTVPAPAGAPAPLAPPASFDVGIRAALVKVEDGMLVFADQKAFEVVFDELQKYDRDQANAWERQLGFVSQRQIFDRIVDAEYQHLVAPYEDLSDDELRNLPPPVGHSEEYEHYLASGLIRTVQDREAGELYDYNLPNPALARVLNEQGFVAVGDVVYQTTPEHDKTMPRGGGASLAELARATKSDAKRGIEVRSNLPDFSTAGAMNKNTGWPTAGSRRGFMQVWMSFTYWNPFPHKQATVGYHVNVKSQKKNFWGNWVYASCPNEVWIWGNWTLRLDYRWATSLGYAYADNFSRSYSYPYHPNCINNFYGSMKAYSGGTMPYPASTILTITNPALAFWDISLTPMQWNAAVPGGCCGIGLQINN